MNILRTTFIYIGIIMAVIGCSPLKQIETTKISALSSFEDKQYAEAYAQLTIVIEKYTQNNIKVPTDLYLKTGESASQLNKYQDATSYYLLALKDTISVEAIKGYVNSLNKTSNYDKVSLALTEYQNALKENGEEKYLLVAQFDNAVNMGSHEKIISTYSKLENPSEVQSMTYISSLEQLGRKSEAASFCNQLIKQNPTYFKAKVWKAIYHYDIAETWYKSEMEKYNKDKNYTAYVYLKRELKKISSNYRVAKNLFEELHEKYPEDKKYVRYLKNTYIRLEMKKEAAKMDQMLK